MRSVAPRLRPEEREGRRCPLSFPTRQSVKRFSFASRATSYRTGRPNHHDFPCTAALRFFLWRILLLYDRLRSRRSSDLISPTVSPRPSRTAKHASPSLKTRPLKGGLSISTSCQLFVRERALMGHIRLEFINTNDQTADSYTKPLARPKIEYHRSRFGLCPLALTPSQGGNGRGS